MYILNKPLLYYSYDNNIKIYEDHEIKVDFEEVINYCRDNLKININEINYSDKFPLDWNDILKSNNIKNKNRKCGLTKKIFSNKINQKQILEYELENDENYENDEEEENDEFQDDNN